MSIPKMMHRVNKYTGVREAIIRHWCDCCNRYYWIGENYDWDYKPCVGQGEGEPEVCPDCEVAMGISVRG